MSLRDWLLCIMDRVGNGERVCPSCGDNMEYVDEEGLWECPKCFRGITDEAFESGFIFTDEEEAEIEGFGYEYDEVYIEHQEELQRQMRENPTGEYYDPEMDE